MSHSLRKRSLDTKQRRHAVFCEIYYSSALVSALGDEHARREPRVSGNAILKCRAIRAGRGTLRIFLALDAMATRVIREHLDLAQT